MQAFLGSIMLWPMNWAPVGWLLCQGQTLPIAANEALFSLLGTTYGGDGKATFMLPNLQGVFPLGESAAYPLGAKGGAAAVTLSTLQMPIHTHAVGLTDPGHTHTVSVPAHTHTFAVPCDASGTPPTLPTPVGNAYLSNTKAIDASINAVAQGVPFPSSALYSTNATGTMGGGTTGPASATSGTSGLSKTGATVTITPTGGATPVPTVPPYLVMNFIICTQGLFPSRQ